jgi:anti-sigma B factor antagonist
MSVHEIVSGRPTGFGRRPRLRPVAPAERVERPQPFEVAIRPDRRRIIVAPRGELDIATVGVLEAKIEPFANAGFEEVVIDLRGLSFIDSTGLCLLVREGRRRDVSVRIVDGPPAIARLFDLTGLRAELPFIAPHEVPLAR